MLLQDMGVAAECFGLPYGAPPGVIDAKWAYRDPANVADRQSMIRAHVFKIRGKKDGRSVWHASSSSTNDRHAADIERYQRKICRQLLEDIGQEMYLAMSPDEHMQNAVEWLNNEPYENRSGVTVFGRHKDTQRGYIRGIIALAAQKSLVCMRVRAERVCVTHAASLRASSLV